ncbi:hypothetical protein GCM10007107_36900 [Shewanella indica]|nr:hypothetical protein GCM10007107_36900 [Shewanella indica]
MKIDPNKEKALNAVLGQIEKQFGKGSIMKLGEDRTSGRGSRGRRSANGPYC